ncbi:MAG TPA: hypothetical protein EYO33_08020 [Phycisphaerales bacterium]|nr:hypothetical protein [Phycisphaerales bacterium]
MRNSLLQRSSCGLVAILAAGVLLTGCSQESAPTATPAAAGTFSGQELPNKVDNLDGTPLYSISKELTEASKLEGATYLLIAPQNPTMALLVQEKGTAPDELSGRESKPTTLSGVKTTSALPEVVQLVKERYELDLQVNDKGEVVILQATAPVPSDATPKASPNEAQSE